MSYSLLYNVPQFRKMDGVTQGGGGGSSSAHTLRMSHMSAGRPYVTFLAPADADTDGARRLHIKTFADPEA